MSREEQKLSGAMRLFEALSGVDEELLAKADGEMQETVTHEKKKIFAFSGSKVRLAASLAAAASLFLVVGAVWTGAPMLNGKKSAETAVMTMEELVSDSITGGTGNDAEALADEVVEEIAEEQEAAVEEEADTGDRKYNFAEKESQKHTQLNDSKTDNIENKNQLVREEGAITECVGSMAPDDRAELSEAQARAVEVLGAYIPVNLPKGYVWETAKGAVNAETGAYESIFLCWTKGMDSIMITISMADVGSIVVTDITQKEAYDVSLYDIPYAETVPEEYRVCFDNPVFAWEDMNLELVQSRMKVVADAGDTDTPRGNFSIIYPEGILLYFNGDGTAEEIWEMLR